MSTNELSANQMLISDWIQLVGVAIALIAVVVSVIIAVITLKQNNKMIEESSRPVISVYTQVINSGSPVFYLVVKNFGNSTATIKKFDYSYDFRQIYLYGVKEDVLKNLVGCTLAPNQLKICALDYNSILESVPVMFNIEYSFAKKSYKDSFVVNLISGNDMPTSKVSTKGSELRTISFALQEIIEKNL